MARPEGMWRCRTTNSGYVYDPDRGDRKGKIAAGTAFKDLPDAWRCPVCGAGKRCFPPVAGPGSTKQVVCPVPEQVLRRRRNHFSPGIFSQSGRKQQSGWPHTS